MPINLEDDVKSCNQAIKQINRRFLKSPVYVACDDLNFDWTHKDVEAFEHMWCEGLSIDDIAFVFKRPVDEIAILVLDRARKGFIGIRKGGVFGNRRVDV